MKTLSILACFFLTSCRGYYVYVNSSGKDIDSMDHKEQVNLRKENEDYVKNSVYPTYSDEHLTLSVVWLNALDSLAQITTNPKLDLINKRIHDEASLWVLDQFHIDQVRKIRSLNGQGTSKLKFFIFTPIDSVYAVGNPYVPQILVKPNPGRYVASGVTTWNLIPEIFLKENPDYTWFDRAIIFAHEGSHFLDVKDKKLRNVDPKKNAAASEIEAYLFINDILLELGGDEYREVFERKIKSFRDGVSYNPNCLNEGDCENLTELRKIFIQDINLNSFNSAAYLTYLLRSKHKRVAERRMYEFSRVFLVELRSGCKHVASRNPNR